MKQGKIMFFIPYSGRGSCRRRL